MTVPSCVSWLIERLLNKVESTFLERNTYTLHAEDLTFPLIAEEGTSLGSFIATIVEK